MRINLSQKVTMAIVKCLNSQCDYFERTVPEGDCCPYCGEPLNTATASSPTNEDYYIPPEIDYAPPESERIPASVSGFPSEPSGRTVVEPLNSNLKLVHTNSGQTFTIDRYNAVNKIYLGRQEGARSDRQVIDISNIPYAERISRLHAYVTWDNNLNSYTIADNDSTNGTILNGKSLTPHQPYSLRRGDRLEFGREHKVVFTIEIN